VALSREDRSGENRSSTPPKQNTYAGEDALTCCPEHDEEGGSYNTELAFVARRKDGEENGKRHENQKRDHDRPPLPDGEAEEERSEEGHTLAEPEVADVHD
jgi:hypothetical protein